MSGLKGVSDLREGVSGLGVGVWSGGGGSDVRSSPEMTTAAVSMHPTGMYSCLKMNLLTYLGKRQITLLNRQ